MGRADWEREADEVIRTERWALSGPNRLVKVLPLSVLPHGTNRPLGDFGSIEGYFTIAAHLRWKTPDQIEKALGLFIGSLANGAQIYDLMRRPNPSEYTHELTADHPDGLSPTFMSDPNYPPGSRHVHQWRLLPGCRIPIAAGSGFVLLPGQRFPG
jgi:hypothetical protein